MNTISSKQSNSVNEHIGQRVSIPSLQNTTGILRYIGPVDNKTGIWAGIELDNKGQGKNDGSVQGKQYFTCPPNSGIFISVNKITILPPRSSSTPKSNIAAPRPSKQNLSTTIRPSKQNLSTTTRPSKQNLMLARPSKQNLSATRPSKQNLSHISTRPSKTLSSRPSQQDLSTRPSKQNIASRPSKQNIASRPSKQNIATTRPSISPTTRATKHSSLTSSNSTPKISHTLRSSAIPQQAPTPTSPPLQLHSSSSTTLTSTSSSSSSIQQTNNKALSPTPPPSQQENHDATNQLYDMLEKIQKERDQLLKDMKAKEAAWERLVSSKESLSVQVQENETLRQRLSRDLEAAQNQVEQLQHSLAEKDASIAKNVRQEEQQTQGQKRIERLETLVRELQQQVALDKETEQQLRREHAGTLEQVRKEAAQSELTSASLEKECEELRSAGLEAIRAYEASVMELKQQHQVALELKDKHVQQLEATIADLRHKQSTLFDDDERDDERYPHQEQDQRHRLEEQLELAMVELDLERRTVITMGQEIDQLKAELNQQRQQTISLEQKLDNVQAEFDKEVQDKKRVMEDADAALESQTKIEDELYQLKLSHKTLEDDYTKLLESNKQLENEYHSLMDEMLVLEKQQVSGDESTPRDPILQQKILQLEKENESHRRSLSAEKSQVQRLSKDLAELESLVENRAFTEAELEEQLEREREKVKQLEKKLDALTADSKPTYCELCEKYGHDIVDCKAELSNLYCDNCDEYGQHSTDDCPNQDETF